MVRFSYIIIFIILYSYSLQANTIDSLKQLIADKQTDNLTSLNLQIELGHKLTIERKYEAALVIFIEALALAKSEGQQVEDVLYKIGRSYFKQQQYEEAITEFEKIIISPNTAQSLLGKAYHQISKSYQAIGNNEQAYENQYKSLEINEALNDSSGIVVALYEIGTIYFYQENYNFALQHYEKSLILAKAINNQKYVYSCLGAIGSVYHRQNDIENSVLYNLKAYNLAKELDYTLGIAYAASNVGSDYYKLNNYDKALEYLKKALNIQIEIHDKWGQSTSYRLVAGIYLAKNQYNDALDNFHKSLELAEEMGTRPQLLEIYEGLANAYEIMGKHEDANYYLRTYVNLKDTLVNESTLEKMEAIKTDYEIESRERSLAEKDQQIQQMYTRILVGSMLVLLILVWMIYSRYKNQFKLNRLLEQKNTQIKKQNEELRQANDKQLEYNELLKIQNRKIQQQNRKLEESNQELQRFAFIASHDLKEPLRTIGSYASLVRRRYKDKLDEDAKEFLSYITSGVSRMYSLLNEVFNYSKLETQKEAKETIDLNETVSFIMTDFSKQIQETNASIEVQELPTIYANQTHITQIFQNLIGNGIKYNRNSPQIIINSEQKGDFHEFCIQDNGIGIDMRYKDKIFDMFQRLHGKNDYEGTGIGLAICKKIVNQYGGDIWIESEVGKGSAFYFTFPIVIEKELAMNKKVLMSV